MPRGLKVVDGQEINLYGTNDVNPGTIKKDGDAVVITGTGTNVVIADGNNLLFQGTSNTIGTVSGGTIFLGAVGDTLSIKNVSSITGNPVFSGTPSFNNSFNIAGNKVWHAGNDGTGSGLDSDLLDGQEGSYYRTASNIGITAGNYISINVDGALVEVKTGLNARYTKTEIDTKLVDYAKSKNLSYSCIVPTTSWVYDASVGMYYIAIRHALASDNVITFAYDSDTKDSILPMCTIIDIDTIKYYNEKKINAKFTVYDCTAKNEVGVIPIDDMSVSGSKTYSSAKINALINSVNNLYTSLATEVNAEISRGVLIANAMLDLL